MKSWTWLSERLHFHFSLSCIGEGNGNPLQCSCLENPRDGGAWWAAIYGVTQSRTRLKRLSSSSHLTNQSQQGPGKVMDSLVQLIQPSFYNVWISVQFSRSVVPNSLRPHEPQHARPPCPSPTPGVHPSLCPLSWWWHPTISSSVIPFSSCPQSFPASGSFQNESALRIRWPKYWSFSFNISPSNEHPGLISFRMDWLDLLAVQGTLKILYIW